MENRATTILFVHSLYNPSRNRPYVAVAGSIYYLRSRIARVLFRLSFFKVFNDNYLQVMLIIWSSNFCCILSSSIFVKTNFTQTRAQWTTRPGGVVPPVPRNGIIISEAKTGRVSSCPGFASPRKAATIELFAYYYHMIIYTNLLCVRIWLNSS